MKMEADVLCTYLNALAEIDNAAILKLVEARVPCSNEGLRMTGKVVIYMDEEAPAQEMIGLMGILNGLLDCFGGEKRIAAIYNYDGQENESVRFEVCS